MHKYYMHTLNGKPAFYSHRNQQTCFASRYCAKRFNILATSLAQIRREQKLDRNHNPDTWADWNHDYIIVYTTQ